MAIENRGASFAVKVRLIVAFIAVAAAIVTVSAQGARTLRFVSPMRPPFTDVPGKSRFALDLVETALGRMKVTATTTIVPPDEYSKALLSGPYDGTALGWRDSEREKAMLFSNPYMENRLVLVGRSGSDVRATSFAELKGKRVALVTGYAYGDAIEKAGPAFVRSRGEQDSLSQLLNSAVDYVLMDELVVQYLVQSYPEEARTRLSIGTIPLLTRPVYLSLHRSLPDAGVIIKGFNSQIRTMIADRTYHKLLRVTWIRADVDGDGQLEYVADSDQAGSTQPKRAYDLFSQATAAAAAQPPSEERYFFGGAVYNGWSSVPDKYKVDHLDRPDYTHPTARILTFSWK
jgi:polar amino acid transport system substrate-binding protein